MRDKSRDQLLEELMRIYSEAPIGLCYFDTNLRFLMINDWLAALNGLPVADHLGRRISEVLPKDAAGVETQLRQVLDTAEPIIGGMVDAETPAHPGLLRSFRHHYYPIRSDAGTVVGVGCVVEEITDRKRVEEALRESEAKIARAQRMAHFGYFDRDLVTGEIVWSDEVYRVFGHRPQEFVVTFDRFLRGIHPDDRDFVRQAVNKAAAGKTPYNIEYRIVRPNGEERIGHTQGEVEFDGTGKPIRMFGTVQDITERKRADEAFQGIKRRNELILEAAGEGIYGLDLEGRTTFINPAAAEMIGWEPEELIGQRLHDILHHTKPDGAPYPRDECPIHAAFMDGKACHVTDEVYWRKDGTSFAVEYVSTPIRETDKLVGAVVVFDDVRKRRQAQEALRESEERLSAILDNVVDGIVTIDERGIVQSFNRGAERLFGYEAEEIIGRDVNMLMPPPDRSLHGEYIGRYLRTGEASIIGIGREVTGLRKDRTTFALHLAIGEVRRDGRLFFIGTLHDLTERKHLEERLRQAEKLEALGRLAGGIAHDFNNVLLPITTITEVTRDELPPDGKLAANLDIVLMAAQRARSLVDQILKFSRRQPMDRRPVGVADVIEEAMNLVNTTVPSTIEIRWHSDESVGKILADSGQIHEVIMNLASNAARAIGINRGVIDVTLRKSILNDSAHAGPLDLSPGAYAHLTMSDTGCGMDDETTAQVFDPFFTTRPVGEGTGLGLAAVHGIVAEHGGAVTVSSRPGQGTTVEIYLPLLGTDAAAIEDAESGTRRVLGGE